MAFVFSITEVVPVNLGEINTAQKLRLLDILWALLKEYRKATGKRRSLLA